jgi:glycosyltransferase involved in cell wall biosynthesis
MNDKMDLLIIDYTDYISYPLGGLTTFIRNLIQEMTCNVHLVGLTHDKAEVGKWTEKRIGNKLFNFFSIYTVDPVPFGLPARLWFVCLLIKYRNNILKGHYDAIFIQSAEAAFPFIIIKHSPPLVLNMAGGTNPIVCSKFAWARNKMLIKLYSKMFMEPLVKNARLIISINDECDDLVSSFGRQHLGKVKRSSVAVNLDVFNIPYDRKRNKVKANFPEDSVIVISAGRLEHVKGLELLIKSFAIFRKNSSLPAFLIICGEGTQKSMLEKMSMDLGLDDFIIFSGNLDHQQLCERFQCADIFAMTSFHEGIPNAMLEAMACGLPVVSTNVGGISTLVSDGVNGYLANDRDIDNFSDLLFKTIKNSENMGNNANDYVMKNHSIKKIAKDIQDEIRCMLS